MGRILALDYGRRRLGVAVSDPLGLTAQPLGTWTKLSWEAVIKKITDLMTTMEIDRILVGYPLTLKGGSGAMAQEVKRFALRLEKALHVPILLWDERFTSVQARESLRIMNHEPSKKREKIDLIAAMLLLQNYLDSQTETSIQQPEEAD